MLYDFLKENILQPMLTENLSETERRVEEFEEVLGAEDEVMLGRSKSQRRLELISKIKSGSDVKSEILAFHHRETRIRNRRQLERQQFLQEALQSPTPDPTVGSSGTADAISRPHLVTPEAPIASAAIPPSLPAPPPPPAMAASNDQIPQSLGPPHGFGIEFYASGVLIRTPDRGNLRIPYRGNQSTLSFEPAV